MPKQYTKEQFWELYKNLPEELKEAMFSDTNTNAIENICDRNEIEQEKISEVAKLVGHVFFGILPLDEFENALIKDAGIKNEKAKKMALEIFRFIFFPVKNSLGTLYTTASQKEEGQENKAQDSATENKPEITEKPIEKSALDKEKESPKADTYREEI